MKIIHTADWHIGKKLHACDLYQDFELFIDWLCEIVKTEAVDVLLLSGDVFDLANPSSESRKQYYNAIVQLNQIGCRLIITGGNHDSPSMLNAPKDLLEHFNAHVIGCMPQNVEDCIIPLKENGETKAVVAAVPFLRDADLRRASQSKVYKDRLTAIQEGITAVYENVSIACAKTFKDVPILAMGHLYAAGVTESDSERDIQIGNQAQFSASKFGNQFSYIALGHIHKPQRLNAETPSFYSGSPLPLSFSERKDEKRILLIDTNKGFEPESIPVPSFRKLLRIQGTLDEIQFELNALNEELSLPILVEVILQEKEYNPDKIQRLEELINAFDNPFYLIVHRKSQFELEIKGTGELYDNNQNLIELKPIDVFDKLLKQYYSYEEEVNQSLRDAFFELVEEINHKA